MDWSTFCNKINCILRPYIRPFEIKTEETKITFKIDETLYEYTKEEFENFKNRMSNYVFQPFVIADPNSYEVLIDNIDDNGMCNIFAVAISFSVNYMDVIARGNDLSLWNKKGGA